MKSLKLLLGVEIQKNPKKNRRVHKNRSKSNVEASTINDFDENRESIGKSKKIDSKGSKEQIIN